jgi:putative DNA primase/helicase
MSALRNMAQALGGDVTGASVICPGPGHSPRDRSLSVTLAPAAADGFLVFSHAGDDWRACRAHVLARLGRPADYQPRARAAPSTQPSDSGEAARALWQGGVDPRGTVVDRYLAGRGLSLPDNVALRVVRYHGACPWRGEYGAMERRPAMLTAFRSIADDRLVAVHRTLLSDDGRKIGRRMLGPVGGAAIKIDPDHDVEQGLSVCEGFETGLAGQALGFRPVWALGSAGAIGCFPLLSGVEALTILGETDDSGANARAVRSCGNRWAAADREVIVATPREAGDMNDAIRAA